MLEFRLDGRQVVVTFMAHGIERDKTHDVASGRVFIDHGVLVVEHEGGQEAYGIGAWVRYQIMDLK